MNFISLSEFKNSFSSALEEETDKNFLIENELREVNNYVSYVPVPKTQKRLYIKYYSVQKGTGVFDINIHQAQRKEFTEAFNTILRTGEFKVKKNFHEPTEAFKIRQQIVKQAFEFAEYYKWLNELKTTPQKLPKKSSLDHKEKLLALHYLGLDLSKFDNKKSAKILSEIIGHSEENTRKYLSYLAAGKNDVRTPKTLKNTLNLFASQGFDEISNTIKADLEKITK